MYTPTQFQEARPEVLRQFMHRHPLATVVTMTHQGLTADHVPLLYDDSAGAGGVLRGHVARANPVWRDVANGSSVLAIFQGPDHYITPSWYPGKAEHGKVVPTWNYVVVHVRGTIAWRPDEAWLRSFLESLTESQEAHRAAPWRIADAPTSYIERMLASIVGFEIAVTAMTGKWKLGQNRPAGDRAGIAAGLAAEGTVDAGRMIELLDGRLGPPESDTGTP